MRVPLVCVSVDCVDLAVLFDEHKCLGRPPRKPVWAVAFRAKGGSVSLCWNCTQVDASSLACTHTLKSPVCPFLSPFNRPLTPPRLGTKPVDAHLLLSGRPGRGEANTSEPCLAVVNPMHRAVNPIPRQGGVAASGGLQQHTLCCAVSELGGLRITTRLPYRGEQHLTPRAHDRHRQRHGHRAHSSGPLRCPPFLHGLIAP